MDFYLEVNKENLQQIHSVSADMLKSSPQVHFLMDSGWIFIDISYNLIYFAVDFPPTKPGQKMCNISAPCEHTLNHTRAVCKLIFKCLLGVPSPGKCPEPLAAVTPRLLHFCIDLLLQRLLCYPTFSQGQDLGISPPLVEIDGHMSFFTCTNYERMKLL